MSVESRSSSNIGIVGIILGFPVRVKAREVFDSWTGLVLFLGA